MGETLHVMTITEADDPELPWIVEEGSIRGFEHCWKSACKLKPGDMLPYWGDVRPRKVSSFAGVIRDIEERYRGR